VPAAGFRNAGTKTFPMATLVFSSSCSPRSQVIILGVRLLGRMNSRPWGDLCPVWMKLVYDTRGPLQMGGGRLARQAGRADFSGGYVIISPRHVRLCRGAGRWSDAPHQGGSRPFPPNASGHLIGAASCARVETASTGAILLRQPRCWRGGA